MILTSRYRYWSRPFAFVLVYVFRKSFNCSCLVTHNYGYLSFTSSYPCRVQRARLHWSPFLQRNKSKNPTKSPGQDLVYAETGQTIHTSKRRNKSEGSTTTTKLVKANIKKPNSNVDWQSEDHLIEKEDASQDPCQSVQIEDEKESEDVEPAPSEKKSKKSCYSLL
ncbi:hypothetical protein Gasu_49980 isoform 2 [Galdieria sulphuraria]|uniref:Uncharacterized protein n=1 Tax=Galdieria sulphuraria TaxID=130081 RepID=M2VW01_GALSU|nr:hypothetical protein Gasu_49980 isoform 2 [Galdieria sulphuraria]EME27401.1 hypothetical protein Gasu_49980 isoform 2 [Galdieria sulphuraria]|eukprot:XP_005703921.1 hypothetical protein isoform 2 [Galdieria sulphuraria]